jgi:radical SAM protein with 4Fe4S-binding SPASM domain
MESIPFNILEKLASDVADFDDKISVVDVCGSGEPLLLPNIVEWIKLLKQTNNIKQLKMITNATLLTFQKAEEVVSAGLDLIIISINGLSDEHYKKITHSKVNFDDLLEKIKYLYKIKGKCKLHIKCIGDYFSNEEREKFLEIFSPICDTIHIDNVINQWIDVDLPTPPYKNTEFSGKNNRFGKNFEFQKKPICNFPFYYLRVHTSCKVSSCATNWKDETIVGDSKIQSLKEIWHSEELNNLRINLLKQENLPQNCEKCKYYEMMTGEDLSPYKDDLLLKYKKGYDYGKQ